MCAGYSPENIFNADETGVFYRALPDRTLATKADECKGGKVSKERLTFFPANTTSVLQPLDQGAIRAFKARYRKRLLRSVLAKIDDASNASEVAKSVNVLDAVYWISGAWRETKEETIRKCFRKGGFRVDTDESDVSEETEDESELRTLIQEVNQGCSDCTVDQYLNFDDALPTEATYDGEWEDQIVQDFLANKDSESREPEEKEAEENDDSENIDPNDGSELSYGEVLTMLQKLQSFALNRDDRYLTEVQNLKSITERHIVQKRCSLKQSSLDSFFLKKP
ncbi:tigger transposable element-derived protein 6-like [Ptychodera flava]|uniref:tigger transposable element-derived protein 6-like n=1 Tax=Ptychodera flava TaxID=63121 RepID=UPI00396A813D